MTAASGTRRPTPRWLLVLSGAIAALGLIAAVVGVVGFVRAADSTDQAAAEQARADAAASEAEATASEAEAVQQSVTELDDLRGELESQSLDVPQAAGEVTDAFNVLSECVGSATTPAAYQSCFDQHATGLSGAVAEEADQVQRLRDALAAVEDTIGSQDAGASAGQEA